MSAVTNSLRDDAIAQAKRNMDSVVDRRHVIAALLQSQKVLVLVGEIELPEQRAVLGPVGTSVDTPEVGAEAATILERCSTIELAAEELRALIATWTPETTRQAAERAGATPGPSTTAQVTDAATGDSESATTSGVDVDQSDLSLDEALAQLEELIGLQSVKTEIQRLTELHRLNQERAARGKSIVPAGLHLVFTGNPGTGKTTVARLVARIYRGLGLLPRGHLVEVQRADLVAGYVGQSALKVQSVINRARGGVLFIDEAYSLVGTDNDYGPEVVATLVKSMEDLRDELAVIVAGYSREMEIFINSNSGLRSRFQRFVDFPDYSDNELVEMFVIRAAEHEIRVPDDVRARLARTLASAPPSIRAGNGRLVRNVFEAMYGRMAVRVNADGIVEDHELEAFVADDVPEVGDGNVYEPPGYI